LKGVTRVWYSYLAVHPETRVPAYAGVTAELTTNRVPKVVRSRAMRRWFKMLAETGLVPEIVIQGTFNTRAAAVAHQIQLETDNPGMLDRQMVVMRPAA
jgi:hypothetical protein